MKTPARFQLRPKIVEALQWTGRNQDAVCAFCHDLVRRNTAERPLLLFVGRSIVAPEENKVQLRVVEGHLETVRAGDWIVRGPAGDFFPCWAGTFARLYERAPEFPKVQLQPTTTDERD